MLKKKCKFSRQFLHLSPPFPRSSLSGHGTTASAQATEKPFVGHSGLGQKLWLPILARGKSASFGSFNMLIIHVYWQAWLPTLARDNGLMVLISLRQVMVLISLRQVVFRSWAAWRRFGLQLPRPETTEELKRRAAAAEYSSGLCKKSKLPLPAPGYAIVHFLGPSLSCKSPSLPEAEMGGVRAKFLTWLLRIQMHSFAMTLQSCGVSSRMLVTQALPKTRSRSMTNWSHHKPLL